jgi:type II pantothenate kinase
VKTTSVGVDMGATLAKIAVDEGHGDSGAGTRFELLPADDPSAVAERIQALQPTTVGITGGGGTALASRLPFDTAQVNEFAAWGVGAARLLARGGFGDGERYLLVSLGTGTSVPLVDGMAVTRPGGTALGGGTILGLGAAMVGTRDFQQLCDLARRGRRGRVDLLVSDIYRTGEIPLLGELTASSFGKLGRGNASVEDSSREDMAAAIMGLVGENVALICSGLAAVTQVSRIVFGGSTLRDNPSLASVLATVSAQLGREAILLPDGEFAGALGGLELARERA